MLQNIIPYQNHLGKQKFSGYTRRSSHIRKVALCIKKKKEILTTLGQAPWLMSVILANLRGRAGEDGSLLKPAWAKSSQDPILTNKKQSIAAQFYHPSYSGNINRRTEVQANQAPWDPASAFLCFMNLGKLLPISSVSSSVK
jgi:hypothetical protein